MATMRKDEPQYSILLKVHMALQTAVKPGKRTALKSSISASFTRIDGRFERFMPERNCPQRNDDRFYDNPVKEQKKTITTTPEGCVNFRLVNKTCFFTSFYLIYFFRNNTMIINSVVLVRKRNIPTERPQPVGEVCANFS
jgi:hypothetical protein